MALAWSGRYGPAHHHASRKSELGDKAWAVEEKRYAHYALFVPIRILSSQIEKQTYEVLLAPSFQGRFSASVSVQSARPVRREIWLAPGHHPSSQMEKSTCRERHRTRPR